AARPSLPLLPFPATTTMRWPYAPPSIRNAVHATAEPARSMSVSTGGAAGASIARISSGVTIGTMFARVAKVLAVVSRDQASLGDDVGDRDEVAVGQRQMPGRHARRLGELGRRSGDRERRR